MNVLTFNAIKHIQLQVVINEMTLRINASDKNKQDQNIDPLT